MSQLCSCKKGLALPRSSVRKQKKRASLHALVRPSDMLLTLNMLGDHAFRAHSLQAGRWAQALALVSLPSCNTSPPCQTTPCRPTIQLHPSQAG